MIQAGKICPYPGLRPFNEEESIFFKGREDHIGKIINQLQEKRFLMVTGASGDGKSSLIYAGLIPRARAGFFKARYNNWLIADFRPERAPVNNLAVVLNEQLGFNNLAYVNEELSYGFSSLIKLYKESPCYLDEKTAQYKNADEEENISSKNKCSNLLILIDQFEELFTNSENFNNGRPSVEAATLINLIIETTTIAMEENLPIYIVCTMRSDYVGDCAAFKGFPEHVVYSQFFVPRLKRQEIHRAILEPAKLSGNKINNRLIEKIINELSDGQDQLPILQHALNRIWKAHVDDNAPEMDLIHFAKAGGISGDLLPPAHKDEFQNWLNKQPEYKRNILKNPSLLNILNAHARELFETSYDNYAKQGHASITPDDAHLTLKKIFTCLTKINDNRAVRNRVSVKELKQILGEGEINNELIAGLMNPFREPSNTLVKPFITSDTRSQNLSDDDILDITHESLIRNWSELTEWTKKDHENVMVLNDFKKQLDRWEESKRSKDYLLTVGSLAYFNSWHINLNPNPYLIAKYDETNISSAEKFSNSQTLINSANDFLSKSNTAIKQKRRAVIAIASTIVFVLVGFTVWAFMERNKAVDQQQIALQKTEEANKSKEEALGAKNLAERSKEEAVKNEALALTAKEQAERSKTLAEKASREARQNFLVAEQNAGIAKKETQKATAALTESEKAKTEAIQAKTVAEKAEKKSSQLSYLSLAQNVAVKSGLRTDDTELQALLAYQAYLYNKTYNGDKHDPVIYDALRNVYTRSDKSSESSKPAASFEQRTIKLSSDGNMFFTADKNGNLYKREVSSEKIIEQGRLAFTNPIEVISFTDWPNIVVTGHQNGKVSVWDITTISKPVLIKESFEHKAPLRAIHSSGENSLLATAGKDSLILLWNLKNGVAETGKKIKVSAGVKDLVLLPDGKSLAAILENGDLIHADLETLVISAIPNNGRAKPWSIEASNDKNVLAIGFADGKIRLYDTRQLLNGNANLLHTFSENKTAIENLQFSGDNSFLAASSSDRNIKVFNLGKKTVKPLEIKGIKAKTRSLMFDNDNKLYACGSDHVIRKIELSADKMAAGLCEKLKRNMSTVEWEQNVGQDVPYEKTCLDK